MIPANALPTSFRAMPVMNEVPLYRNIASARTDAPLAYVGMKDTLVFLDSAQGWSRVSAKKNIEGFIESRLIVVFSLASLQKARPAAAERGLPAKSKTFTGRKESAGIGYGSGGGKSREIDDLIGGINGLEAKKAGQPILMQESKAAPAPPGKSRMPGERASSQAAMVRAAAHDDNAEFPQYLKYCAANPVQSLNIVYPWDASKRIIVRVLDRDSQTVPGANLELLNRLNRVVFTAATPAGGEIIILPTVDLPETSGISLRVNGGAACALQRRPNEEALTVVLSQKRQVPRVIGVQICFLMDATGSMGDEIKQLQDVVFSIHERLRALPGAPDLEFSVTAYRDRGDDFLVRGHAFTANIDTFQNYLNGVAAGGGGDNPEDVEAGLAYALDTLRWKSDPLKFIFLIADAPPHTETARADNYLVKARQARGRGIMICPVGASGLDKTGEFVFRQLALVTGGDFVFLNYGETGESEGAATAADPGKVSHHTGANYNARRLDDLVVDIVRRELAFLDPKIAAQRRAPQPATDAEVLDLRLTSLLTQVLRGDLGLAGKTLVVAPFAARDTGLAGVAAYLEEGAIGRSAEISSVKVVERARLQDILKEQALAQTGLMDPAAETKAGKLLGADFILVTQLNYLGITAVCHARLIDCASGAIVSAARVRL
ncbi:MAG: CsgG/HfaB family protein [Chitinivibrionales bacterium]|nr:CsgG/HfaB family protein [Chitinivibrionales bacterium]